jgi:hypothetical protein
MTFYFMIIKQLSLRETLQVYYKKFKILTRTNFKQYY